MNPEILKEEGAHMTTNTDFSQLTGRANEAQAKIKAAASRNRAELQAPVLPAGQSPDHSSES
jgi:hypothetical protein